MTAQELKCEVFRLIIINEGLGMKLKQCSSEIEQGNKLCPEHQQYFGRDEWGMTDEEDKIYSRIVQKRLLLVSLRPVVNNPDVLLPYQLTEEETDFYVKWLPYKYKLSSDRFAREQEQDNE